MSATNYFIDPLESRTFLSATPVALSGPGNLAGPAGIEVAQSFRLDLGSALQDLRGLRDQLADASQSVRAALEELKDDLAPLREQLAADLSQVKDDLRAMRDVRKAHRETILADVQAIHDARESGDDEALADAKAALAEHRAAREEELSPLREQFTGHLQAVKADRDAIKDVIDNDPEIQSAREKVADLRAAIKSWFAEHFG